MLEHLRSLCAGYCLGDTRYVFNITLCLIIYDHLSVGMDLIRLYESPPVQSFLNGASPKELFSDKAIYSHGTLRKVLNTLSFTSCPFCLNYSVDFKKAESWKPPSITWRSG